MNFKQQWHVTREVVTGNQTDVMPCYTQLLAVARNFTQSIQLLWGSDEANNMHASGSKCQLSMSQPSLQQVRFSAHIFRQSVLPTKGFASTDPFSFENQNLQNVPAKHDILFSLLQLAE